MKIDEKDKQLLSLLQKNCKLSLRELSQITEMRETTIFARIKRLENAGIIKEYRAILDPKAIGKNVLAFVLIKYDPSAGIKQREVAEKIANLPEIQEVHIIAGDWDMIAKVREKDVEGLGKAVLDKIREIKGVKETVSLIVFESIKETTFLNL
ncbi:Lrp/AsnC family transcriptional regulator [Candidatus Nanobsidianus stetteri]|jgi:DNA-binding Lrp family transcriptional regulator|uniref:AsnC family transcriptional regulator n=1 Tax=Nanobsidianus stetteri TaxID=1294122 RepID=A0A2T9WL65_NANST|nr:Lrp/AsnC family transcriptional regulator [Candidatus Nanobsidianus stetteri]MCC5447130.1 Lrp/AsnC family transcriptional regulator [Candidatus Nanobsidianus stetteri]